MTLHLGDCLEVMATIPDASIDAIVTDPPYGLEFMGKDWDRPWAVTAEYSVGYEGREGMTLPVHRDSRNANCRTCGGRARGANRCQCETPDWDRHPREDMLAFQRWTEDWSTAAFRILKPGGHLLAFGGSRTYHRLAAGIEDAGFEIRDSLMWLYGSGFPKSQDVAKFVDRALGVEGDVGEPRTPAHADWIERGSRMRGDDGHAGWQRPWMTDGEAVDRAAREYLPGSDAGQKWKGWGTALKPAHEPIVFARKPLRGTVAANLLEHGVGALNVEGCRVGFTKGVPASPRQGAHGGDAGGVYGRYESPPTDTDGWNPEVGRWPSNVILSHHPECVEVGRRTVKGTGRTPSSRPSSTFAANPQPENEPRDWTLEEVPDYDCHPDCPLAMLDDQSGDTGAGGRASGASRSARSDNWSGRWMGTDDDAPYYGDTGGASRFFYCAKVSKSERNAGLDAFPERSAGSIEGGGSLNSTGEHAVTRNVHPTVKPIDLMRWLIRLVTPPGGTLLDPFTGSGSTGCAAALEQVEFVGIERDPDYHAIAAARIGYWADHGEEALRLASERDSADRARRERADAGQLDLFAGEVTP